jgi:hypothetical protein
LGKLEEEMKVLFAIVSCNSPRYYPEKAQIQRQTWVRDIEGADYRFFFGDTNRESLPDEVILDCPDDYNSLNLKTKAILYWAIEHGYDAIFKCDDDSYVFPRRLLNSEIIKYDYAGCYIPAGKIGGVSYPAFAGGGGYWLSSKAAKLILDSNLYYFISAEDRNVGFILSRYGIKLTDLGDHTCMTWMSGADCAGNPMRLVEKPIVVVHTCTTQQILDIHSGKETLSKCYTRVVQ